MKPKWISESDWTFIKDYFIAMLYGYDEEGRGKTRVPMNAEELRANSQFLLGLIG